MSYRSHGATRRTLPLRLETLESRWLPAPVVPAYSSWPTAPVSLYLDFDGHYQSSWGNYRDLRTSAFDLNGNPDSFSSAELSAIREVWARVAEDFAPFNLNVTTVEPGPSANARWLRVAVGATTGLPAGIAGLAYLDAFTNEVPNVAYVLPARLGNQASAIATGIAHEAGHAFGLRHQTRYDSAGRRTEDYHTGDRLRAPLMGDGTRAQRSVWWYGPTDSSATSYQDDMALLARADNGFGYRADDHGDSARNATTVPRGTSFRVTGIIGRLTDQDWFAFTTTGGNVSLSVQPVEFGPNLDAVLELYRVAGNSLQRLAVVAPSNSLGAALAGSLPAGTYYAVVRSQGVYGDVGMYALSGTVAGGNTATESGRALAASDPRGEFSEATGGGGTGQVQAAQRSEAVAGVDRGVLEALLRDKRERV